MKIPTSSSFWPTSSNDRSSSTSYITIINIIIIIIINMDATHCLFYTRHNRMDHPWLKDTIQYDPYEEPDYPQPEEAPTDLPKWAFSLEFGNVVDTGRLL